MNSHFLQIHKQNGKVGAVIAAVVFAVCCIWYSWQAGVLFGALFLCAGFLKLQPGHPFSRFVLNAFWGIVCIFVSCVLPTKMVSDSSFLDIGYYRVIMNFVCAAIVYGACLTVTGEIKKAVALASGLLLLLATVNGFIFQFRGNEFKPTDIFAAGTALNVAGQYSYRVPPSMAYCWFTWLWMVFCLRSLPSADDLIPRRWFRAAAAAASVLCLGVLLYGYRDIRANNWSNGGSVTNGYYLNFAAGIRDAVVRKPEGYSSGAIAALEEEYRSENDPADSLNHPNIIVIMSESFADSSILGNPVRTNLPVTPFIDSLQENTIKGYALTSVFGGMTANAEFEFLTGSSMAFLPEGSVPYHQYIHRDSFSLVRVLETYGYSNFATHPYFSSGWNRTEIYPMYGFDRITFDEAYPGKDLVREFISDREMYGYVLETLAAETDDPLFLFGITMQNHGDYIYAGDNYEQTIFLEGYEMEHPMAEQYLSLLRETDRATEVFLTQLEAYPEDTVVLFFGDHFPQVESNFFKEIHGGEFETLSERLLQYTVPYFIWANYDIPEQTLGCTSLNYLAVHLLQTAGITLPPYYQFLKDMEAVIPSVNAQGYYSASRQTYLPLEEAEGEEAWWLNRYAMVQYNNLFDKENVSAVFFGEYLQ